MIFVYSSLFRRISVLCVPVCRSFSLRAVALCTVSMSGPVFIQVIATREFSPTRFTFMRFLPSVNAIMDPELRLVEERERTHVTIVIFEFLVDLVDMSAQFGAARKAQVTELTGMGFLFAVHVAVLIEGADVGEGFQTHLAGMRSLTCVRPIEIREEERDEETEGNRGGAIKPNCCSKSMQSVKRKEYKEKSEEGITE